MTTNHSNSAGNALMLPGGGARGAYQVGALKAISELNNSTGGCDNPFPIITGTSAGAINAGVLASQGCSLSIGVERLEHFWCNMRSEMIFRTDLQAMLINGLRWFLSMYLGFFGFRPPRSLLDNTPLHELLRNNLTPGGISEAIRRGNLRALAINASGYTCSDAVSFFQGHEDITAWQHERRRGERSMIDVEHLLASSALPLIFPAVRIGNEYFGDGGMRLTAPLSTALQLGARRILVISTRDAKQDEQAAREEDLQFPSLGEIGGAMMDIIFLDNLNADIQRTRQLNEIIARMTSAHRRELGLRHTDVLHLTPSADVREIAYAHSHEVPAALRFMLRRLGADGDGRKVRLPSYLLFEQGFCRALIDLGYRDVMDRKDEIEAFLHDERHNE
ncbi:MAG: patatin-like phospholipase family protein [Wenzhouxiangellaceae bacterium]